MKIDWKKRAEAAELALQNEIVRWQKRIYDVCRKVYPEVDGGGCDSGDELDFSVDEIEQTFAHLQDALQAKEQELGQWKGAIIDAAVVDWVYTKEHETNPRKAINDLIAWNCKVALDPKVSKPAADLVAQARQQAVAECAEIAESNQRRELEHRKYGHELRGAAACKIIADEIRSLTPPPITTTVVETLSDLQEQIRPPISQKEKP